MSKTPFYEEHWVNIEAERLERYQTMFGWNPASKPLHDSADIREGHVVADFGCGPGHTAIEIARWVGPEGYVHAFDINEDFVGQCRDNARKAGFSKIVTPQLVDGATLQVPKPGKAPMPMRNFRLSGVDRSCRTDRR